MSVYTKVIIHWKGSQSELEEIFNENWYDSSCSLLSEDYYFLLHKECDIFDFKEELALVESHKMCEDIFIQSSYFYFN